VELLPNVALDLVGSPTETVPGEEHPSTLTSMNNLVGVLSDQGKYMQAEEMHRQTLRLRETFLVKESSSTLRSIGNLASLLWI
jgi:Tetratricopeptide repeat